MAKTDNLLQILLKTLSSPSQSITKEDFNKEMKGVSDKTKGRYLKALTSDPIFEGHTILRESEDGQKLILNKSLFKYTHPEHLETPFLLDVYKKIGHLYENGNFKEDVKELTKSQFNGHSEQMGRKFYYLSKTSTKSETNYQTHLANILSAFFNNNIIHMNYNQKTYERIYPLSLIQYREALYLMAYKDMMEENAIRTFKLDRIKEITLLEDKFTYPNSLIWNPQIYFENSSGIINDIEKEATIRVYGESRIHFKEKSFFSSEQTTSTKDYDEYTMTYSGIDEFLGQLFVYAQDIEIISPPELKSAFTTKANLALKKNAS